MSSQEMFVKQQQMTITLLLFYIIIRCLILDSAKGLKLGLDSFV